MATWKETVNGIAANKASREDFVARQDDLANELENPSYDQSVADDYYTTASPQIDEAFYGRSKDIASDYAKRGLSSSGMSVKSQTDAAFDRAAQLRQAKQQAIQYAKNQRRSQLVDEAMIWNDWNGENQKLSELGAQDSANEFGTAIKLGSLAFL